MNSILRATLSAIALLISAGLANAQGTNIAFGDLQHDSSLPVELAADELSIDQINGIAEFVGNVVIGQGGMRLSADKVIVRYGEDSSDIESLDAFGHVLLVNGAAAAQSDEAKYSIVTGEIIMIGNVIVTQGKNAMSSSRMVVDLETGSARMAGRVKTVLMPSSEE